MAAVASDHSSNASSDRDERENEDDETRTGDEMEERFRVDRRKLEQMLQATDNGPIESGEKFFKKIMEDTLTHITWPAKLKIGAKSKKANVAKLDFVTWVHALQNNPFHWPQMG
ncbi:uncharacterized protein TRIADDRAFT_59309 [Trichoplax adhaerens]|uniref:BICC1 first type I KH domain-containing protein n=1 Tax=Trichoplax adhaerens TaxID=10228 RepID=B3S4Q6_TRIAD|nr:hypothetical protein TRIADDRAFT_59309 [Trichoplax adhaerens]EDV22127.1 hypothetical protein TRIADDRAFT_59309 [Trichoplax adhaerens]|eukprot:XP_002115282.1 hypothetical protein TRIADDRAFT_59309 [Trichoplax adhaerens]